MIRLGSVIAEFETDFVAQFRHRLGCEQLRALSALRDCRSPASPMMQLCNAATVITTRLVPHSCGHRLCPHCLLTAAKNRGNWRRQKIGHENCRPGAGSRAGASPAQQTLDAAEERVRCSMAVSAASPRLQPC
jgi:hypothetical protein